MRPAIIRFTLALVAIGIGGGILAALVAFPIPDGNTEPLLLALGLVLGWGGTVFSFYFGNSDTDAQASGKPGDPVHYEEETEDDGMADREGLPRGSAMGPSARRFDRGSFGDLSDR